MTESPTAPPRSRRAATRPRPRGSIALAPLVGTVLLVSAIGPAQAQLRRGLLSTDPGTGLLGTGVSLGTSSPGEGILGTGLTVSTTVSTTGTGGLLGTGATVGTTGPGEGVLGTGVTLGTSGTGGLLGTGVTVGTTGSGEGLLGTGINLGTAGTGGGTVGAGPTGSGPTGQPPGPTTSTPSQVYTIDSGGSGAAYGDLALRLSRLEQQAGGAVQDVPLRGTDTSRSGLPRATGQDAVAGGYGASAGGAGSTALGNGASTAGDGSVAIGRGAGAAQANAVALGAGARTSRAGQVALGTAQSSYTMAGLGSAASQNAQSGPTRFVTTDAGGNLAASDHGPASIAALDGRVGALEAGVGRLQRDMRGAYQGTAIALALTGAVLPAGKSYAVSTSFGTYRGETGFGASGVARIADNLFVSGGVGFSTSGQANVAGRGGLTLAW